MRHALLPLALLFVATPTRGQSYDPLRTGADTARVVDLTVRDNARARDIPLRIYLPTATAAAPVVLYSHGLGGSTTTSAFLGRHWAARGYVAVFMQHAGSDERVWTNIPAAQRMAAMRSAANVQNTVARFRDIPAVLDQLTQWNTDARSVLRGRMDLARVGMSGHSFGAVTTQGVSGQRFARSAVSFTETRINAALVMSPSTPRAGDARTAFADVRIPWMLMTGTEDVSPIGDADLASRLGVYPALPTGGAYELVLDGAQHSVFTDRTLPGEREPRNPNHHRVILALSTAFWDATLRSDAAARAWLDGSGPRSVMEPKDRWQHK